MGLLFLSGSAHSQSCEGNKVTITLTGIELKSNAVEFDITIANTSTAGNSLKLASLSGALIYEGQFADGKFTVVNQPAQTGFADFRDLITGHSVQTHQLRWMSNPVRESEAVDLPPGKTQKFARFRFERSGGSIPAEFISKLKFQQYVQKGYTAVNANVYCNGNSSSTALANGKGNASSGISKGRIDFRINALQSSATENFTVTAYPNPFTENFQLAFTAVSDDEIQIKVYDMLGKLIENRNLALTEIENTVIGTGYPSGIYNVNVRQRDQSQTIRIAKR